MSELASIQSASNGSPPPDDLEQELDTFLQPLVIDDSVVHNLAYQFSKVYEELAVHSEEQFLPTPVTKLPSGRETGQFLAIDVGGTNLRVAFIELLGDAASDERLPTANGAERSRETIRNAQRPRVRRTLEKAWPIGEHLKMDKTEDLFAWVGDCVAEVVSDRLTSDMGKVPVPEELPMGITFSFPMIQTELSSATLMPMGKGFTISSDLDLGSTLLQGYARHTRRQSPTSSSPRAKRRRLGPLPRLKIAAITNDTIATLASLAYTVKSLPNSRVAAGIIVGTGCNATIPMPFSKLGEAKSESIRKKKPDATETVVNTEITIAGACGPLQAVTTDWDRQLDAACARPGFQPLEYMTGGRYIGELVRIIFVDYMTTAQKPPVSPAALPATIVHSYSFTTTFVSAVVARARSDSELAGELKRRIPPPESSNWGWTPHSAGALRKIAHLVQVRSAGLIAAATVGLLAMVGEIALTEPGSPASLPDAVMTADSKPASPKPNFAALAHEARDGLSPAPGATAWKSGPEELVIAYTGGIIQHYPNFKEQCQRFIDRLVMRAGPQDGGKSVFLRESRDGGIIGAGVLAGMEASDQETHVR
ncbi:serine/threonine protein kinase [Capronia epimyces CBS 606.96]|uniref:Phosphotransferase n=1 Tax=Capronia epimyces CBS 606.96 TaxID=1182542 RepID=W9Y4Z3_9EURO|nr:serine/threonine protein kinase [Capronia epimyces CBS 606.96]EXJ84720.1 serine/threonine protein kinase [Capronia epimyces CBS 606.96]